MILWLNYDWDCVNCGKKSDYPRRKWQNYWAVRNRHIPDTNLIPQKFHWNNWFFLLITMYQRGLSAWNHEYKWTLSQKKRKMTVKKATVITTTTIAFSLYIQIFGQLIPTADSQMRELNRKTIILLIEFTRHWIILNQNFYLHQSKNCAKHVIIYAMKCKRRFLYFKS